MNDRFLNIGPYTSWPMEQEIQRKKAAEMERLRRDIEEARKVEEEAQRRRQILASPHSVEDKTTHAILRGIHTTLAHMNDHLREIAMALKPRVKAKAPSRAIFLGKDFEEVSEASGKVKVKPKRKHGQTRNQQYASANRKKWKAAK